ncbi:MAG: hypothetical protein ACXWXT_09055 [Candidatus Binatia bacterium]
MQNAGYLMLLLTWTLWTRTISPTSDNWSAAPGLGSRDKCLASVKDKLDMWKQFKDAKFDKNTVIFTGNNSSMTYLCLPDGDDPRKPAKAPKPAN